MGVMSASFCSEGAGNLLLIVLGDFEVGEWAEIL